jgi:hypothetical protein
VNVETSRNASIAVIRDADMLASLVNDARQELVDAGLAAVDELVVDPQMTLTVMPQLDGDVEPWVSVAFRWERIRW